MNIVRYPHPVGPMFIDGWVMLGVAAVTLASAAEYLIRFWGELTSRGAP